MNKIISMTSKDLDLVLYILMLNPKAKSLWEEMHYNNSSPFINHDQINMHYNAIVEADKDRKEKIHPFVDKLGINSFYYIEVISTLLYALTKNLEEYFEKYRDVEYSHPLPFSIVDIEDYLKWEDENVLNNSFEATGKRLQISLFISGLYLTLTVIPTEYFKSITEWFIKQECLLTPEVAPNNDIKSNKKSFLKIVPK